jgi:hypothetical protein
LGALMASTVYEAQPPAWRSLVDRAYQEAATVLMPQPQAGMPAPGGAPGGPPAGQGAPPPEAPDQAPTTAEGFGDASSGMPLLDDPSSLAA